MSRIAVGLREDERGLMEWLTELGADTSRVRIISEGVLRVADIDKWIGTPSPAADMVWVGLRAPERSEGEEPRWLEFRPGEWKPDVSEAFCYWISDLIAVRVADQP